MKKIVAALLCLAASAGYAQSITGGGIASQFNNWKAYAQSGPYGNTNIAVGANTISVNPCQVQGDTNHLIPVFSANTPIKIVDLGTPSLSEVFTPTTVTNGGCTATFTAANAHGSNYYFASGTYGLQEAINATTQSGVLNTVTLSAAWFNAGGTASTIYNAVGNPYIVVEAANIRPIPPYRWNTASSHYIPVFSLLGIANPTLAAGAAAGTAPTVSNNAASSGNIMTANVTTGTATTTGTLFTETVGTPPPTGNMNCTVQNGGANIPPAFTWTTAAGVLTVTVAVAPPVSTAFIFNIACN